MVWRAIRYGYPSRTPAELGVANRQEAFTATKQAVFTMIYGWDPAVYNSFGTPESNRTLAAYQRIMNDANNSTAVPPSSHITVIAQGGRWEVDVHNPRYVSMVYEVTTEAPMIQFDVSLEGMFPEGTFIANINGEAKTAFAAGDPFKVLMPIRGLRSNGNFTINVHGAVATRPVWHGRAPSPEMQDYAITGAVYEDGRGSARVYFSRNSTRIIIIKQDSETEEVLGGVEFELLDENQNVIYTGLITCEEGRIEIYNLIPGRYYIREVRALPGFILYEGLIEAEVGLNEVLTVIIGNSQEEPPVIERESEAQVEVQPRRLPRAGF